MRNSKAIGVLVNIAIYLIAFAIGFIPYFFMLQANIHPILNMLVLTCTATLVMYIFCVVFKNTSIYDPYWSVAPFIMVIIHMVAYRLYNINSIIFAVLVFFYTVRLTRNWYLTYNGLDPKNEDWRYQKYRNSLSKWKFEVVNLIGLIFMPTLVVYACLIPGLLFMFVEAFTPLALIGFFFMLVGPFLELISDYQVHKFIKDNDDHSLVCDIGLWNYSRHPNYLGELTFWFGIMLVFLLTRYDIWYFGLGFIFMFSLFMFISIPLMEKHNIEKRPAYLEYKKHTSKLFILPRKKIDMKYKAVVFDLDGTLLDTLKGITDAVNKTFEDLGYNVHHDYETAKNFIGAGAFNFVKRAMKGLDITPEEGAKIGEKFLYYYDKLQNKETKPFEGIPELLKDLKKAGYIVCLASNKPQRLLEHVIDDKFPNFDFDMRLGQRQGIPEKPNPHCLFEVMNKFKLTSKDIIYVGDSIYDYQTAHNGDVDCCIVKYGYGFYDQDFVKKSTYNVDSVSELRNLLLK